MSGPFLLSPSFTSPERTPWGGHRIGVLKAGLVPAGIRIGESWELSAGPELGSRLEDGRLLAEVLAAEPALLGQERGGTALLVKLLDAAEALSVQIHPADDDPALGPGQSGKPEVWYVEHREPGAAIWLGLAEEASPEALRRALEQGEDLSALLGRVEVEPGDLFSVEPGTPHAIGAGVTLVEPQRVRPGARAITYRYWDWNRKIGGVGRELHVERALAVTRWDRPRGEALLAQARHRAGPAEPAAPLRLELLAGDGAALPSALTVERLHGTGEARLPAAPVLRSITVLAGTLALGSLSVPRGRTALVPAGAALPVRAEAAHAIACRVSLGVG